MGGCLSCVRVVVCVVVCLFRAFSASVASLILSVSFLCVFCRSAACLGLSASLSVCRGVARVGSFWGAHYVCWFAGCLGSRCISARLTSAAASPPGADRLRVRGGRLSVSSPGFGWGALLSKVMVGGLGLGYAFLIAVGRIIALVLRDALALSCSLIVLPLHFHAPTGHLCQPRGLLLTECHVSH